jgi:arylsulfatase A-like enzyme
VYDPVARVPLLVKFPGGRNAGTSRQTLVSLTDLAPTILRQAGVEPPPAMRGLDLADANADRPFVFAGGTGHRYMARSRTHKLLLGRERAQCLFFDLERDPLEMTNLFEEPSCQPRIEEYRRAITDWLMFDAPPPVYRDANALRITAPDVPPATNDHRAQMYRYFEEQFRP